MLRGGAGESGHCVQYGERAEQKSGRGHLQAETSHVGGAQTFEREEQEAGGWGEWKEPDNLTITNREDGELIPNKRAKGINRRT